MFAKRLCAFFTVSLYALSVIAADADPFAGCSSTSKEKIGEQKNVVMEKFKCPKKPGLDEAKIQSNGPLNVCGDRCDSSCYKDRPAPYYTSSDCDVLYKGIWYESQNHVQGNTFTIDAGDSAKFYYGTCLVYFVNKSDSNQLKYCMNDLGSVLKYLTNDPNNACKSGGTCTSIDQSRPQWYIAAVGQNPTD
ncbi:immunomodulatory protein [Moniliophthora roreri MCA 2997]|uniref:Immunomodulatory protein n=1 Tax=Moniliophthora roreri (strain MCA 2997) TaxID=1381753 RepID=V2X5R0_MONRO|nr:immunomodulatory protein [Moniliophthora roreri MCA 2997]